MKNILMVVVFVRLHILEIMKENALRVVILLKLQKKMFVSKISSTHKPITNVYAIV